MSAVDIEREWQQNGHRLGLCCLCGTRFQAGEPVISGEIAFDIGVTLFRVCDACGPTLADPIVRERIAGDAYRALFGAGPDDVGGTA